MDSNVTVDEYLELRATYHDQIAGGIPIEKCIPIKLRDWSKLVREKMVEEESEDFFSGW